MPSPRRTGPGWNERGLRRQVDLTLVFPPPVLNFDFNRMATMRF